MEFLITYTMKTLGSFFAIIVFVFGLGFESSAQLPLKPNEALVVTSYEEILKWLTPGAFPKRGVAWTQPQIDNANTTFNKKLSERPVSLKMRIEVADIFADGSDMVLFSSLPNREEYRIRVFAKFPPAWKDRLAMIGKGDKVTVTAPMTSLIYKKQWNEFALVIETQNSAFSK